MPRDEDDVLLRHAEVGHLLLGLGEDRVVAAARAPADLLVGHEVLPGQLDDRRVLGAERRLGGRAGVGVGLRHSVTPRIRSACATISAIVNGLPRTRL